MHVSINNERFWSIFHYCFLWHLCFLLFFNYSICLFIHMHTLYGDRKGGWCATRAHVWNQTGADTPALFVLQFALEWRPVTVSGCITLKKSFVCKQKTQKEVPWCSCTVCAHWALSCSRPCKLIIILLWSLFHQWETLRGGARVSLIYTHVTILLPPLPHAHTHTHTSKSLCRASSIS